LRQPDRISSKKHKSSSITQRESFIASQNADVAEAEEGSDSVIEIKLPNGPKKHIHSDLQMEEPSYHDMNAAGPSEADVEMAEAYIEDQQEQANHMDDVPDSRLSPPAAVSDSPDNNHLLVKELDEDISAQDDSKMDCVSISEEFVHTPQIPNDDTDAAVTPEGVNVISSLNKECEVISSIPKETIGDENHPLLEDHTSQQPNTEVSEKTSLTDIESEVTNPTQSPTDLHYKTMSPSVSKCLAEDDPPTTHDIVERDNTIVNTLNDYSVEIMNDSIPKTSPTMVTMDDSDNEGLEESHVELTTSKDEDQIIISEHDVMTWKDQGQGITRSYFDTLACKYFLLIASCTQRR
jgi:hypothetical protein